MARRVLVADDEPSTAEVFALMLAFSGYDVERAADGEEALRLAREQDPDVLLLDVCMPKLDGRDVARCVRDDPVLADKVVVLFSSIDEGDLDWRASGADAFLQKPVDIRELPVVVEQLIGTKSLQ